jgi:hypothetical protein
MENLEKLKIIANQTKRIMFSEVPREITKTNYQMYDVYVWKKPYLFGMLGKHTWILSSRTWSLEKGLHDALNEVLKIK